MTPAVMTGRTRAQTAPASSGCPPANRWPAGTLAAAGTIPARTMNAYATLVFSQGHHPANHRSAIPTRVYESGSGHGHDAAPAGHPHPPRPPPEPRPPGGSRALAAHHRAPGSPRQGRLRRRPGERSAHLDPAHRSQSHGSYQDTGSDSHARLPRQPAHPQPCKPLRTRHRICRTLTSRFI